MSITDIPHDNVVQFHAASMGTQARPGIATDASMQALAEKALSALSVCDDAHTEAYLAVSTLRAVASSNRHGAERMWMLDTVMANIAAMKDQAKHIPRPPSFFRDSVWFDALFKPIDATVTLLAETIYRDCDRSLRINLAAKLAGLLKEVDDLMHRVAASWEHARSGEQQSKAH
jgi:hypothetical protein